jgi:hypothetical protein
MEGEEEVVEEEGVKEEEVVEEGVKEEQFRTLAKGCNLGDPVLR